jgi:hypothetical protein
MGTQSGSTNSGKPCAESGMFVGVDACVRACVCVCVCALARLMCLCVLVCSTESNTSHWTITYQKCRIQKQDFLQLSGGPSLPGKQPRKGADRTKFLAAHESLDNLMGQLEVSSMLSIKFYLMLFLSHTCNL